MKSSMYLRKTIACPDCGQPNKVQFYVLDLVSEGTCEHCGHVVKFRRPMETRYLGSGPKFLE
jgi:Zn ribbon nucleic-acid-binding protein